MRLDNTPTTDGRARGRQPQHEEVAASERHLVLQTNLNPGFIAWLQLVAVKQRKLAQGLGGAGVKADLSVVSYGVCVANQLQARVDCAGRFEAAGGRQNLAAAQVFDRQPRQIYRGARASWHGIQLL